MVEKLIVKKRLDGFGVSKEVKPFEEEIELHDEFW